MAYKTLRNNLKDLLDTLTGSGQPLEVVYPSPKFKPSGYPFAFIARSGNESDYQSTQDNMRVYAFKVWVITQFDVDSFETADDLMYDCIDAIINKLDEQESPTSDREMANNLASQYTLAAVEAAPTNSVSDEVEKLIAVEVTVRCKVLVDLTVL